MRENISNHEGLDILSTEESDHLQFLTQKNLDDLTDKEKDLIGFYNLVKGGLSRSSANIIMLGEIDTEGSFFDDILEDATGVDSAIEQAKEDGNLTDNAALFATLVTQELTGERVNPTNKQGARKIPRNKNRDYKQDSKHDNHIRKNRVGK